MLERDIYLIKNLGYDFKPHKKIGCYISYMICYNAYMSSRLYPLIW